jgi:hypothetical protein
MIRFYSKATGCTYFHEIHSEVPADAVPLSEARYQQVIASPQAGKVRSHDDEGLPILIDPPPYLQTAEELCALIDTAADLARLTVAGDPLRAVEYDRSRIEAEQFAAAGYQGEVPPMVAAWAINGRTAHQAADDILREAGQYTAALVQLRTVRLQAKELIRTAMAAGNIEQAEDIAAETIASIQAAVAGIGNNA